MTSGLVVPKEHSKRLVNYFDDKKQRYKHFCDEWYVKKSKKICDTITKVNLPKFDDKDKKQKKNIDVAKARGISTKEILCFDDLWPSHPIYNKRFEEDLTVKPAKKKVSERTGATSYFFRLQFHFRKSAEEVVVVDFVSLIWRYPTSKLKTFNDLFSIAIYSILHLPCIKEIGIVYDSHFEDSIKGCERIRRRSSCEPFEFINLKITTHMFQPSRFEWETSILRDCLPSSRLISKSPVLRETCPNFQFFVKIPICIASYFVFWCFNCITAIGNAKNTL